MRQAVLNPVALPLLFEAVASTRRRESRGGSVGTGREAQPTSAADPAKLLDEAEKLIDMRAPLVWQVHKLNKAQYLAWAHSPFHYTEEPKFARLFASDLLEPFSKTRWWQVPLVWLPVCVYLGHWYAASATASLAEAALILVSGLLIWSLVEYSLHRFVFHLDDSLPDNGVALTLHFLLHGVHHRVPMDRYRLVMPPAMTAMIGGAIYVVCRVLIPLSALPWPKWHLLFAAGMLGYICYDMMHYAQHHLSTSPRSYVGAMKRYHMKHHFSGQQGVGFGITSKLWDVVFGTTLDESGSKAA